MLSRLLSRSRFFVFRTPEQEMFIDNLPNMRMENDEDIIESIRKVYEKRVMILLWRNSLKNARTFRTSSNELRTIWWRRKSALSPTFSATTRWKKWDWSLPSSNITCTESIITFSSMTPKTSKTSTWRNSSGSSTMKVDSKSHFSKKQPPTTLSNSFRYTSTWAISRTSRPGSHISGWRLCWRPSVTKSKGIQSFQI